MPLPDMLPTEVLLVSGSRAGETFCLGDGATDLDFIGALDILVLFAGDILVDSFATLADGRRCSSPVNLAPATADLAS
jgi:hypothetical protein